MLNTKADIRALQTKIGVEDFNSVKNELWAVGEEVRGKTDQETFSAQMEDLSGNLDILTKDLVLKANVKDICQLLDQKANVEDINKILLEIHKELDAKAAIGSYTDMANE
jgi:hypothetical protein